MFNVWEIERKKNEEIKERISSSNLIPVYSMHPSLFTCVSSFNFVGLAVPEKLWQKICFKIRENKKWRNKRTHKSEQPESGIHGTSTHCPCMFQVSTFSILQFLRKVWQKISSEVVTQSQSQNHGGQGKSSIHPIFSKRGYNKCYRFCFICSLSLFIDWPSLLSYGLRTFSLHHVGRVKRIWYLSPMRASKVQASLRIRAVSPEPPLLAHTSSESRGTFRQKTRSLALLNCWACAV